MALTGCGGPAPQEQPAAAPSTEPRKIYQVVGGQQFATEAERDAYLQSTETARRERELIRFERYRQERIASDLGALQEQRRLQAARIAEEQAQSLRQSAGRARTAAETARRSEDVAETQTRQSRNAIAASALQRQADLAERAEARALHNARVAETQADAAERAARLAEQQARMLDRPGAQPPWKRLIRYRKTGEGLSDFRRRVVQAITKAQTEGGQVQDYL